MEKHIRRTQVPLLGLFQPPLALPCIPTPLEIDCNPVAYPEPSAQGWLTEGEEKKKVFCCFFSGKNRSIHPVLADICILSSLSCPTFVLLHPKPLRWKSKPFHPVLKRSQLPLWQLAGLSLQGFLGLSGCHVYGKYRFAHTYQ